MKGIEEIQHEIAKENGLVQWPEVEESTRIDRLNMWPEVAKRYAIEVSKAALENAAKNVNVKADYQEELFKSIHGISADKSSITDERNIPKI